MQGVNYQCLYPLGSDIWCQYGHKALISNKGRKEIKNPTARDSLNSLQRLWVVQGKGQHGLGGNQSNTHSPIHIETNSMLHVPPKPRSRPPHLHDHPFTIIVRKTRRKGQLSPSLHVRVFQKKGSFLKGKFVKIGKRGCSSDKGFTKNKKRVILIVWVCQWRLFLGTIPKYVIILLKGGVFSKDVSVFLKKGYFLGQQNPCFSIKRGLFSLRNPWKGGTFELL